MKLISRWRIIPLPVTSIVVRRVSEIIVTDRTKAPNLAHLVFEAWALRKSNAPRTWIARKDNYVITEIDNICYLRSAILDLKIFPKRKKTAKNYVKVLKNNKMVQKNCPTGKISAFKLIFIYKNTKITNLVKNVYIG